ncbi:Bifunctional muramidase/lytic transglycosylase CwlQ [Candidatus Magnetomoraceae bacterium gMMP-15]
MNILKIINKITVFTVSFVILSAFQINSADIYYYKDKDGVIHFTNVPDSSKYSIFIRGSVKRNKISSSHKKYSTKKYDRHIYTASRKYGVEFPLIKAVIRAESAFNPVAVSPKGARGLMQIMPQNFSSLGVYNPFDPKQNIMGGTRYLKKMLNRFGKLSLALAAYNAGPTLVASNNRIPHIKETQNYVKRVMRFYNNYRKIY